MEYRDAYDPIPLEDVHETHGPNDAGMMTHQFYAFNTVSYTHLTLPTNSLV